MTIVNIPLYCPVKLPAIYGHLQNVIFKLWLWMKITTLKFAFYRKNIRNGKWKKGLKE